MNPSLEDTLYQGVTSENYDMITWALSKGANPNKTVKQGKTGLGEAARRGNSDIIKLLLAGNYNLRKTDLLNKTTARKRYKSKIKQHRQHEETIVRCKNLNDRALKDLNCQHSDDETLDNNGKKKNQGYFVFIHSEDSSSTSSSSSCDESKISNLTSPLSPSSLTQSPQADLEWDEEIGDVASSTSEDDNCTSMYKWYASILELTGAAIVSAKAVVAGINQQDAFMRTALHYASEKNHLHIVKLLLESGCKVDIPTGDGLTPLHLAANKNNVEVARELLMAGSGINFMTNEKMIPLHFAALNGCLRMVKLLVSKGARLEVRDENGRTALYIAVKNGHVDVVKYLISIGANVNVKEFHEYSPLCEAVWHGSAELVEILIRAGAHVTPSDRLLHFAIRQRKQEIATLLAQYSATLNLVNEHGDTPLLCATKSAQPTIVRVLLRRGANVNARNSMTLENALHVAIENVFNPRTFEEIVKILFNYRIDSSASAVLPGDTPLNRALLLHRDDAAAFLIRYGVNVNYEYSPCCLDNLTIASRKESYRLVSLLLKAGDRSSIAALCGCRSTRSFTVDWFKTHFNRPLRLQDLCRIKIRHAGRHRVLSKYIETLPLPITLKKFLMMENED